MAGSAQSERPRHLSPRGWCCLALIALPSVLLAAAGWYMLIPRETDLTTLAEISRLPLPEDATLLHSSAQMFAFHSAYAHVRMSEERFGQFRAELDFELTREAEMVQAASGQMAWHHGDEPEWWRPDGLNDPLAAWASRPASPAGEDWSRWVAVLADEKHDGTVEIFLFATQDP